MQVLWGCCMRISSILANNYEPSMKAGLYFTKTSNVLFNKSKNLKYITDEIVKVSNEGSRYIEDTQISEAMKKRFMQIPFIKQLAEKFDTFIFFREIPKDESFFKLDHISYSKISWADYSLKNAQSRDFVGKSRNSQLEATKNMLMNIDKNVSI